MKANYLVLGIGAVVVLGSVWVGRMAWRVHRQLVTLDVREMPLRDALRKVERQTWKKIRVEKALDARITLHVNVLYGENLHHRIEAVFKAFGRALREATTRDERVKGALSTKGSL